MVYKTEQCHVTNSKIRGRGAVLSSQDMTQMGKVSPLNSEQRLSLLDRAVSVLRNSEDRHLEPLDRAKRIGGAAVSNCGILRGARYREVTDTGRCTHFKYTTVNGAMLRALIN
eukprot:7908197-Pyramimonas_sp.AAC.2